MGLAEKAALGVVRVGPISSVIASVQHPQRWRIDGRIVAIAVTSERLVLRAEVVVDADVILGRVVPGRRRWRGIVLHHLAGNALVRKRKQIQDRLCDAVDVVRADDILTRDRGLIDSRCRGTREIARRVLSKLWGSDARRHIAAGLIQRNRAVAVGKRRIEILREVSRAHSCRREPSGLSPPAGRCRCVFPRHRQR